MSMSAVGPIKGMSYIAHHHAPDRRYPTSQRKPVPVSARSDTYPRTAKAKGSMGIQQDMSFLLPRAPPALASKSPVVVHGVTVLPEPTQKSHGHSRRATDDAPGDQRTGRHSLKNNLKHWSLNSNDIKAERRADSSRTRPSSIDKASISGPNPKRLSSSTKHQDTGARSTRKQDSSDHARTSHPPPSFTPALTSANGTFYDHPSPDPNTPSTSNNSSQRQSGICPEEEEHKSYWSDDSSDYDNFRAVAGRKVLHAKKSIKNMSEGVASAVKRPTVPGAKHDAPPLVPQTRNISRPLPPSLPTSTRVHARGATVAPPNIPALATKNAKARRNVGPGINIGQGDATGLQEPTRPDFAQREVQARKRQWEAEALRYRHALEAERAREKERPRLEFERELRRVPEKERTRPARVSDKQKGKRGKKETRHYDEKSAMKADKPKTNDSKSWLARLLCG